MGRYEVAAAAVQVVVGARAHFVERGALLPDGVSEEDIKRLVREGLITKYTDPDPAEQAPPAATFSQADFDAAVEAKVLELEQARAEAEKQAEAEKVEAAKQAAADAEAAKKVAAKPAATK